MFTYSRPSETDGDRGRAHSAHIHTQPHCALGLAYHADTYGQTDTAVK